ncbi:hypothetical protein [Bacteroides sp.]|uniref:hypothetical protein n=1 Tax=Bacteroides sp. TaxID=29523 RepID=UPI00262FF513|nr:hypothetical protein [Bacteroides sp.]MDD3039090.1 hypothetical protein [Bacteroides sp.]
MKKQICIDAQNAGKTFPGNQLVIRYLQAPSAKPAGTNISNTSNMNEKSEMYAHSAENLTVCVPVKQTLTTHKNLIMTPTTTTMTEIDFMLMDLKIPETRRYSNLNDIIEHISELYKEEIAKICEYTSLAESSDLILTLHDTDFSLFYQIIDNTFLVESKLTEKYIDKSASDFDFDEYNMNYKKEEEFTHFDMAHAVIDRELYWALSDLCGI